MNRIVPAANRKPRNRSSIFIAERPARIRAGARAGSGPRRDAGERHRSGRHWPAAAQTPRSASLCRRSGFLFKLRPFRQHVRRLLVCAGAGAGNAGGEIAIDRLRDRIGGPVAPTVGEQRLQVLAVGDVAEFDQHRRHVRRPQAPGSPPTSAALVQPRHRLHVRRPACARTASKSSWSRAARDRSGCRRRRRART